MTERPGEGLETRSGMGKMMRRISRKKSVSRAPQPARETTQPGRIVGARECCSKLVRVVSSYLPRDIPTTRRHDDWAVTGPAFIARSTRLVQAVLALPDEHEAAAGVLVRVLYEHVTTFAWIAMNPAEHLPQWVRRDRGERIKADNDMQRYGRPLLSQTQKSSFVAERNSIADKGARLATMAQQADKHWAETIPEFSNDVYSLGGMYVVVYRQFSALVHAMPESLHRVVGHGPRRGLSRVGVEAEPSEYNAFTNSPFVYAMGLLVSSEVQGFPKRAEIHGCFERPHHQ